MHDHHCVHVLAYCGSCDVAYCKKCSREWGKYTNWRYPYYTTTTTSPDILTSNTMTTTGITYPVGTHSQGDHTG